METITTKFDNFGKLSISENRRYLMEGDKAIFLAGRYGLADVFEIRRGRDLYLSEKP